MRANVKALIALLAAGTAAAQTGQRPAAAAGTKAGVARTVPVAGATVARPGGATNRIAGIAPPPVVVVIPGNATFFAPPGSFLANIPVVVFPDGRIFADFGRGFEHVVRGCSGGVRGASFVNSLVQGPAQPTVVQPVVVQPPVVVTQPLPYNPPLPGQQVVTQPLTPSTGAQILAGQSVIVNSFACWGRNSLGQVFIFSP